MILEEFVRWFFSQQLVIQLNFNLLVCASLVIGLMVFSKNAKGK